MPTIDAAVAMRDLSIFESDRVAASQVLKGPAANVDGARSEMLRQLRNALHAGMLLTYAQGMALLRAEIQTVGGYGVAATIYAGTEERARQMAKQAIAAWEVLALTNGADQ